MASTLKPWLALALFAAIALALSACDDAAGTSVQVDIPIEDTSDQTGVDTPNPDVPTDEGTDQGTDEGEDQGTDEGDDQGSDEGDTDPGLLPCTSEDDCPVGQTCVFVDDEGVQTVCDIAIGNGLPGDECSEDSDCASGACVDGACISPCSETEDCPDHFECESTTWSGEEVEACIEQPIPCLSEGVCEEGEICLVDRDGNALVMECGDPLGDGLLGSECTEDSQCASGLCLGGVCVDPCERNVDCSDDGSWICEEVEVPLGGGGSADVNLCQPAPPDSCTSDAVCTEVDERCVAVHSPTEIEFLCGAPNPGGEETGLDCTDHSDCAQNLCVEGVCAGPCQESGQCPDNFSCDLAEVPLSGGGNDQLSVCLPPVPCDNSDLCLTSEVCSMERGVTDIEAFCGDPNGGNTPDHGDNCNRDSDCRANFCFDGRFFDYCSELCDENSDCESGFECVTADVALDSTASPTPTVERMICKAIDPTPCDSAADCASGNCAIVLTEDETGLESVCLPDMGGAGPGVVCNADNQCDSQVCFNGFCSAPCEDIAQCASGQVCANNNVEKVNEAGTPVSGSFEICETLPEQACTSTDDCTDGVRVCGGLQTSSSSIDTFCVFPNEGNDPMGDACTANSECFHNICNWLSDECTVACELDTHCDASANQICTSYHFSTDDLGICARACADNDDCVTTSGNPDAVCTTNRNHRDNVIDLVCEAPVGAGVIGDNCTGTDGSQDGTLCQSSLCLRTYMYNNNACVNDSDCAAFPNHTCERVLGATNFECATTSDECTSPCDEDSDCQGVTSACGTVTMGLPDNSGTQQINVCTHP